MTHTYSISGMTCNGCANSVQQKLSKVAGVTEVKVDLEKKEAAVTMDHHISLTELEGALAGSKYAITNNSTATEKEAGKNTYLPIFLIFGFITLVTLLIQFQAGHFNAVEWMSHFMAGFFLVFSFFKLLDVPAFAESYAGYDIAAKNWKTYGYIYPFIELALGISFLIPSLFEVSNIATLVVMSVSIVGVLQSVLSKRKIQCACLGAVFNLPMSTITIIEDGIMIAMSATCLIIMHLA